MNRIKIYGYALLVVALLIAASMPIAFRLGSAIPTITLLLYMSIVGTITSFLMMATRRSTPQIRKIISDKRQLYVLVAIGVLAFALEPLALAYATHNVSADLTSVVFRTWPIMLVLLAPFIIREKVSKWDVIGVSIGFLGLAATLIGNTAISIPYYELPFVGVVLFAAFIDALSTAISKRYNYELTSSIFVFNIITLVIFVPLAIYTNSWQLPALTANVIFAVLFLGVFTQAIFAYIFYESVRLVRTSLASTAFVGVSFLTLLLSYVFLGEAVKPYYIIIAVSVVAGIAVQRLAPKNLGNFISSKKKGKHEHRMPLYDVTSAFINTKHAAISDTMKGNGRVLAFYTDVRNSEAVEKMLSGANGDNCILFTDSHKVASPDEMAFIKEIMGCDDSHMVVMGSGDPDRVTEIFSDIRSNIDGASDSMIR